MKRLIFRALNPIFLILLVALALVVQSTLFHAYPLQLLQPDLVLVAVLWCAFRRTFTEGGILTLVFAEMAETHSAALNGIFLISYMAIYLGIRAFVRLFVVSRFTSFIFATMASAVLLKLIQFLILAFLGYAGNSWRHMLIQLFPSALTAALMGLWCYRALERFDQLTFKSERSQQLIEDELLVEEGI